MNIINRNSNSDTVIIKVTRDLRRRRRARRGGERSGGVVVGGQGSQRRRKKNQRPRLKIMNQEVE